MDDTTDVSMISLNLVNEIQTVLLTDFHLQLQMPMTTIWYAKKKIEVLSLGKKPKYMPERKEFTEKE